MWNMSNKSRRQTKDGRSSEIWIRYMAAIASQHLHKLFMFHKSIKWQTNVFRAFYCDLLMLLFHFNEWNGSNQSTTMTVCTVHCALCRCVCSMYEFLCLIIVALRVFFHHRQVLPHACGTTKYTRRAHQQYLPHIHWQTTSNSYELSISNHHPLAVISSVISQIAFLSANAHGKEKESTREA